MSPRGRGTAAVGPARTAPAARRGTCRLPRHLPPAAAHAARRGAESPAAGPSALRGRVARRGACRLARGMPPAAGPSALRGRVPCGAECPAGPSALRGRVARCLCLGRLQGGRRRTRAWLTGHARTRFAPFLGAADEERGFWRRGSALVPLDSPSMTKRRLGGARDSRRRLFALRRHFATPPHARSAARERGSPHAHSAARERGSPHAHSAARERGSARAALDRPCR